MNQNIIFIIILIAIYVAMFYFSSQRRKRAQQQMNTSLTKGTRVVTIGGMYGVVDSADDAKVVLDVEGVYLTFERRAIARVLTEPTEVNQTVTDSKVVSKETTKETSQKKVSTSTKKSTSKK